MKYLLLLPLIMIIAAKGNSQGLDNALRAIQSKAIGQTVTQKNQHGISEATYLGSISNNTKKIKYWVVKEFYTVQAAIAPHGHSRILFFDRHKKLIAEVVVHTPAELPEKIHNNALLFHYSEYGIIKKFSSRIDNKPEELCVDPTSCYSVNYK